jgi:hypothetical protein
MEQYFNYYSTSSTIYKSFINERDVC